MSVPGPTVSARARDLAEEVMDIALGKGGGSWRTTMKLVLPIQQALDAERADERRRIAEAMRDKCDVDEATLMEKLADKIERDEL